LATEATLATTQPKSSDELIDVVVQPDVVWRIGDRVLLEDSRGSQAVLQPAQ